jgi:flagellar protein FliO/FliZ
MDPTGLDLFGRLLPPLVLIVAALLAVRRFARGGKGHAGGGVRVLSRTGVARNSAVVVLAVGERRFLVGAGDHGVSLLSELEPDDDGPDEDPAGMTPASNDAATELAPARPAYSPDRPWMGLINRLQHMTVRSHPDRPIRARRS